ncbi:MAG: T9SS type A sorting domain-containing protein [candidate division KSB1 bacterium]|nr:T9SS type A sorting domain-containing protein [candidate division KSB1 bacterium]
MPPNAPDAERRVRQILAESGFDALSPVEVTRLSRLLQRRIPDDMLRRLLQRMTLGDRYDRRQLGKLPRPSLPISTANDQPLTAAQQAVIAQVLEDFQVNENVGGCVQYEPAIAVDANGNFVVVWQDERNGNDDVYTQRYNSSGATQGANFRVNDEGGSSEQRYPAIAADGSGHVVVVWMDERNGDADIYAQLFDSQGQKIGANYRVNNDTGTKLQRDPDVKLVNGHIYTTRQDDRIEGQGWDIFARVDDFVPAAPGLSSPQNNSTLTTNPPALTFTVPADAHNDVLHFRVEISRTSGFTSPITGSSFESKNNTSGFSPTPPLPSGTGTCTFTVPAALGIGDYWWRVSAWDGRAYGSSSTSWKFTIVASPTATTAAASNVTANSAKFNGTVNPNGLSTTVKFQYGTSTSYGSEIAAPPSSVSGTSSTSVSAQLSGLSPNTTYHYRVVATDSLGTTYGEDESFRTSFLYPSSFTLGHAVNFPSHARGSDYQPTDYRILGLPGASNAKLSTLMPGVQEKDWQAYWDNGAASDYFVPFDGSDVFIFSVGRAFWLIHKGPWTVNTTVASPPLNASNQAEVPLHAGWNLITNPFTQSIAWSAVQAANAVSQPIWAFNGTFTITSQFSPYEGYYFDNTAAQLTLLKVPYPGALPRSAVTQESGAGGWQVQVVLTTGACTDSAAWFGVSDQASSGLDALDFRKPRAIGPVPLLCFRHPEWDEQYPISASDIRPPVESLEKWQLEVATPVHQSSELTFLGLEQVPSDLAIWLVDERFGFRVDLRQRPGYSFTPTAQTSKFTILVGQQGAIEGELTSPVPTALYLGSNFPNPFNATTTIPVAIPAKTQVSLRLYNARGEMVRTAFAGSLEPGTYQFHLDGKDEAGYPLHSGVYLYRLVAGTHGTLTRKMILIR